MKIKFTDKKIVDIASEALILPICKDSKFDGQIGVINKTLGGWLEEIIKDGYYTPELGEVHVVYSHGKLKSKKIILVGLGNKSDLNDERYYKAVASAISYTGKTNVKKSIFYIGDFVSDENVGNIIEVALLSLYKFHHHKAQKSETKLSEITFVYDSKKSLQDIEKKILLSQATADGIYLARDLSNHPSNIVNPKKLVKEAKEIAKGAKEIKTQSYSEVEILKMGMGLFGSVARGSDEEAQMIIIDYKPKKYTKTIAFVGKGLTFDSGGISIKPSDGMDLMKMDMAGAAAVLGAFRSIAQIKPKGVRIIGAIGACENIPGHKAQKPGDIWKAYNGKTVEVLNTDAEGRLVLADVISYIGKQYKPEYMIDLATLTGACMIALGFEYTGLFSNNQKMAEDMIKKSNKTYEKLWQMPIDQAHHDEMKSDIADLQNIGKGREAGASTAAAFLEEFVDPKIKWAHMDIAGSAIQTRPTKAYIQKGGSGAGVKTLIEFIMRNIDL